MSAVRITLPDGTKVEGDSGEEVGKAALVLRRTTAPAAKPVQILSDEVHRILRRTQQPRAIPERSVLRRRGNGIDVEATTLQLLEAIKEAGNHGLTAEKVQRIVHADTGKGIGGRMVRINGYLRRLGFTDSKELFDNPKNRKTNSRVWKPKGRLDDAIDAARKAVKA